jgi:hypothetical protein
MSDRMRVLASSLKFNPPNQLNADFESISDHERMIVSMELSRSVGSLIKPTIPAALSGVQCAMLAARHIKAVSRAGLLGN